MSLTRLRHIQSVDDARRAARRRLPRMMFDFIDGGAGNGDAMQLNQDCLASLRLQPRVFVNVEKRNCGTTFLGQHYQRPFGIAPMGMCALAWPATDCYFSLAAKGAGIPVCVSTAASMSLEDYREMAGEFAWFQLYVGASRDAAWKLVERADRAGYEHLILTVDTPAVARRPRELRSGFNVPFEWGPRQLFDLALHPVWSINTLGTGAPGPANFSGFEASATEAPSGGGFQRGQSRGGIDFDFLSELRERWKKQLIVKGVLCSSDAVRIQRAGADAIYVSNHGGRQLDSAPAAIQMLPRIREAVGDTYPLIFDSGIRSGEDAIKAIALGANFVMLGRPFLYAVGAAGLDGLNRVIDLLGDDIDRALAQIGCLGIKDITTSMIVDP